jgi:hypothetical protein
MPLDRPSASRPRRLARRAAALAATVALAGCATPPATAGDPPAGCSVDLLAQFSPAVQRPTSTAFLQSLVQGSGYHLRFVRTLGTTYLVRLTGPDSTCDDGIALLRRAPSVRALDIDERQFRHAVRPPEPT